MNPSLIYDVGGHVGEDTDFYLKKGFKVVTIEANPVLAERLRERFRSNLCDGSLVMVETAIAEKAGELDFYVNESLPRNGAVSMGQRNTCSTCLLAGVLRAKVGREG